ncbi:MAG: hypothetical protein ACI9Z4_000415 [Polaribacter sp.]|jgi:hypothetical protein
MLYFLFTKVAITSKKKSNPIPKIISTPKYLVKYHVKFIVNQHARKKQKTSKFNSNIFELENPLNFLKQVNSKIRLQE